MDDREEVLIKRIEELEKKLEEERNYIRLLDEINSGLRKYLNEMTGVYRLLEALNVIRDMNKIYDLLLDIMANTIDYRGCIIYMFKEGKEDVEIVKEKNKDEVLKYKKLFNVDKKMYEWIFKKKHVAIVPKGRSMDEIDQNLIDNKSFAIAPLVANEKRIGYIDMLIEKSPENITQQELSIITLLLNQTTIIIENLKIYEKEKETIEKLKEMDEMKSDIMITTSHELRTPLTILKGSSRVMEIKMKEDMWEEEDKRLYKELIHNVNTQADILEEITNTLLAATKFEHGELVLNKKVTNIKKLIEDVIKKLKYKSNDISIEFSSPNGDISAIVDPEELKKVISNLLKNAIKYSSKKGKVEITLEKDIKNFLISVRDYGSGIPKEEINKIFDKFYRLDRALTRRTGGMGFGLYISKLIVENHGGRIWAESEINKGSIFYVKIPLGID